MTKVRIDYSKITEYRNAGWKLLAWLAVAFVNAMIAVAWPELADTLNTKLIIAVSLMNAGANAGWRKGYEAGDRTAREEIMS